jgi:hypothetical protein
MGPTPRPAFVARYARSTITSRLAADILKAFRGRPPVTTGHRERAA